LRRAGVAGAAGDVPDDNMRNSLPCRIFTIALAHGPVAPRFKSAYVAARLGILVRTKTTALDAARHRISANPI